MELWVLIVLVGVFVLATFQFKLPIGIAFLFAALAGGILGGFGVPVRHLIEGAFTYLDAVLIIWTAMIFMEVLRETGALGTLSHLIIVKLHRFPAIMLVLISFFVMFPGLLTGLSSASVLTTGALIAPALVAMGIPPVTVGAYIAITSVFGMIGPPINLPVMIIGSGVDMPFVGFELPLAFTAFPLAILSTLVINYKYVRKIDLEQVKPKLPPSVYAETGFRLFLPILVVALLFVAVRLIPQVIPDIGVPLIFTLGSLSALISGRKFNLLKCVTKGTRDSLSIMALLVGVGMFVQIMGISGVRGFLAVNTLKLPAFFLFAGLAVVMPAFGSAFASATIMGVPVLLALLGYNELIVAAALSLIGGVGDMMPPPTMLCVFSAQVMGIQNHYLILKKSLVWIFITILYGIAMILSANLLAKFLIFL